MIGSTLRRGRGFTIIEFVVSSALVLTVLVGSSMGIASTQRSLAVARAKDAASARAFSVLEQSAVAGCQGVTDPRQRLQPQQPNPDPDRASPCAIITDPDGTRVSIADDTTFTITDDAGRVYTTTLTSRYRQTGNPDSVCAVRNLQGEFDAPLDARLPSLLERRITVEWSVLETPRSLTFTSYAAVPASTFNLDSGSILVHAEPGTVVQLRPVNLAAGLSRIAAECSGGNRRGAAWFPFLPPGGYVVIVNGVSRTVHAVGGALPVEVVV